MARPATDRLEKHIRCLPQIERKQGPRSRGEEVLAATALVVDAGHGLTAKDARDAPHRLGRLGLQIPDADGGVCDVVKASGESRGYE
jgi:hypothetical protein